MFANHLLKRRRQQEIMDQADLDDQRDRATDQAIHDIGGVGDGADHRQHETDEAEPERDGGRGIVVADQLEFVVRRDAGVNEEVGDDGNDGRAEIQQKRRQSGQ